MIMWLEELIIANHCTCKYLNIYININIYQGVLLAQAFEDSQRGMSIGAETLTNNKLNGHSIAYKSENIGIRKTSVPV